MLVTLRDQRVKGRQQFKGKWRLDFKLEGKERERKKGHSDKYAIVTIQV